MEGLFPKIPKAKRAGAYLPNKHNARTRVQTLVPQTKKRGLMRLDHNTNTAVLVSG
jgi:hypothetical protein